MRKLTLLVMLIASGCDCYHQSAEEMLAPDALTLGAQVNQDQSNDYHVQSYNFSLRWDLK